MPTHKNTPAFHERAAHIAERAMPVCKGMAKLYPMIYKNVNTGFERILKMRKIIAFLIAAVLIFFNVIRCICRIP